MLAAGWLGLPPGVCFHAEVQNWTRVLSRQPGVLLMDMTMSIPTCTLPSAFESEPLAHLRPHSQLTPGPGLTKPGVTRHGVFAFLPTAALPPH